MGAGGIAALGIGSGISGALVGTIFGVAAASEEFDEHLRFPGAARRPMVLKTAERLPLGRRDVDPWRPDRSHAGPLEDC